MLVSSRRKTRYVILAWACADVSHSVHFAVRREKRHQGPAVIPPLRKRTLDGVPYTRDGRVEGILQELHVISREDVLFRLSITNRSDPRYVPSECLVHLVRGTKLDNSDRYFQRLYGLLMARVVKGLPKADTASKNTTSLPLARIREAVLSKLNLLLAADRTIYSEALDYFEVRFDGALASARKDAADPVWREGRRNVALELDDEIGAGEEVEKAMGGFDPFASSNYEKKDYRLKLDQAIDTLPPEQKRIIEMLRQGIPIDSEDADAITISRTLDRSEKTIRTHRDRAFDQIRRFFRKGSGS